MRTRMKAAWPLLLCIALLPVPSSSLAQSENLATKSRRAKEFMAEGKFAEAIPLYRELNHALPNNPGLLLNLGMALHMAGDERKSIPQLEAAVKLDPELEPAWLFLGTARLQLGDALNAVAPLRAALRLQPDHREARLMLAGALLSLERNSQAAEEYRKVADIDPASSPAWYGLGLAYEGLAQKNFDTLANLAPGSAYWLDLVAESRMNTQQRFSAFFLYRQAQEKMPSLRGTHAAVAEIYRKTGHADWAATEDEREKRLSPPDCTEEKLECDFNAGKYHELVAAARNARTPESYYWLTHAYNALARDAYTRLAQLPSSAQAEQLMAKMEVKRRQYVEAVRHWQAALTFSPADTYIKQQLAISVLATSDLVRARELFQELLESQPESPELNYYLGDVLLKSQKPAEALPFLQKAVLRNPALLPAHASLARTYLALGQADKSIPHLKAALSIDDDGSLHYELGRAYQAHGQFALARQMLKQYQEIHGKQEAEKRSLNQEMQISAP